jgi:hypothetical protein
VCNSCEPQGGLSQPLVNLKDFRAPINRADAAMIFLLPVLNLQLWGCGDDGFGSTRD